MSVSNIQEETPLHKAVKREDVKLAKLLLRQGVNLDARDKQGNTPLHYAAHADIKEIIWDLLDAGALITIPNRKGKTAYDIVKKDSFGMDPFLEYLISLICDTDIPINVLKKKINIQAIDINHAGYSGDTFLHIYSSVGKKHQVERLLAYGANPNIPNKQGKTVLSYAQDAYLQILVEAGADLNVVIDQEDNTLLHEWARYEWQEKKLIIFLKGKADCNKTNKYGETPLHFVAKSQHLEGIKLMLTRGNANCNTPNKNGQTPFHLAAKNHHLAGIKLMLQHGADPNKKDINGFTALYSFFDSHNSMKKHSKECLQLLLMYKSDANYVAKTNDCDSSPTTLLELAINHGDSEIFALLASHIQAYKLKTLEKVNDTIQHAVNRIKNMVNEEILFHEQQSFLQYSMLSLFSINKKRDQYVVLTNLRTQIYYYEDCTDDYEDDADPKKCLTMIRNYAKRELKSLSFLIGDSTKTYPPGIYRIPRMGRLWNSCLDIINDTFSNIYNLKSGDGLCTKSAYNNKLLRFSN